MSDERVRPDAGAPVDQRRANARRDLEELAEQVELGEIDEATAALLRAGYEQELADAEQAPATPRVPADGGRGGGPLSPRRAVAGAVTIIALFTVAILFIGGDTEPTRQGAAAGAAAEPAPLPPIDGARSLTAMEEAVAADPERIDLRLALADAYFQERQYSAALTHYLTVLESDPDAADESVALGRVGWMAFITNQHDAARQYLEGSLAADPTHVEGKLFLGYVLFYGFDDATGAVPLLEEVLAATGLTAEVRADVEGTLAAARAAGGG